MFFFTNKSLCHRAYTASSQRLCHGACALRRHAYSDGLWQEAGSTIALADGDTVCRAVPVRAQLRLPGKVAHVIHAGLLKARHQVSRMHIRDDERVNLPT